MHLTSIFTLLPLLAMMVSATPYSQQQQQSSALNGPQQNSAYGEPLYQQDNDQGDYHEQPESVSGMEERVDDERVYDKQPDSRSEDDSYAPTSPSQTVVIVVAKSQHSSTSTRTILTASGSASTNQSNSGDDDDDNSNGDNSASKVQYVSPEGRPLTPATSTTMFPINRTVAIRNNYKENRHLKKNKLYPRKTKCLTVRRHGLRNRFRAVLEHCDDDQRFWLRSPMSFHFEDAGEDTVVLTWMDPKGTKRCARHEVSGTRFYPCNDKKKPTRYEILPTKYEGKFKVKQHGRNRCFDFEHSTLWMNRCRHFKDQAVDFVTVAFDQN